MCCCPFVVLLFCGVVVFLLLRIGVRLCLVDVLLFCRCIVVWLMCYVVVLTVCCVVVLLLCCCFVVFVLLCCGCDVLLY